MSFYINDVALKSAFFNGSEVKSIYYKGVLVWEAPSFTWPGWSSATWEDIYNLCKAKQEGIITEWPSDVNLNSSKNITLSPSVLSTTTVPMRVVGIDIDGNGVLTFIADDSLTDTTIFGDDNEWSTSTVRSLCTDFYNACNAKNYIKPLQKETCAKGSSTSPSLTTDYVWLPSAAELNLATIGGSKSTPPEYTSGVKTAYPHFNADSKRIRYPVGSNTETKYYTRTKSLAITSMLTSITEAGVATNAGAKATTQRLVPGFAIG